ncbi:sensor histidine kinase [Planctomycetota bacterium]
MEDRSKLMEELEKLDDAELVERLDALRAEELRRLGSAALDPKRARFFQQTEKLATLGVLARGLAHEFNNLFSGVIAHCDYALKISDDEARTRALEVALASTRQASMIVKNIQRFAREQGGEKVVADPVDVVARAIQLLGPSLKTKELAVKTDFEPVSPFAIDTAALQQLTLNLLTNAMQASPPGGEVSVSVSRDGDLCVIAVTDQGQGIPEEDRERVFTPFFSTKGVYARNDSERRMVGTGLGLAASFGIARRHGGTRVGGHGSA